MSSPPGDSLPTSLACSSSASSPQPFNWRSRCTPRPNAYVVAENSDFDRRLVDQARAEFQAVHPRVPVEYMIGLPMPDLLDTLAHLPARSIVLYSTMFADGHGRPFVPHQAAKQIADRANAPVYAFLDQYLGEGIVGGHLYSLDSHGAQAADLALRILGGTPASAIPPIEPSASSAMFDWRQLRRWGVDEGRLPPGAIVQYRVASLWERHRTTILITLGVLLLQSGTIVSLLVERRNVFGPRLRCGRVRHERQSNAASSPTWDASRSWASCRRHWRMR